MRGPRSSSFWLPRNLSNHMDIGKPAPGALIRSREMIGRIQNTAEKEGKDDRKRKNIGPVGCHHEGNNRGESRLRRLYMKYPRTDI